MLRMAENELVGFGSRVGAYGSWRRENLHRMQIVFIGGVIFMQDGQML